MFKYSPFNYTCIIIKLIISYIISSHSCIVFLMGILVQGVTIIIKGMEIFCMIACGISKAKLKPAHIKGTIDVESD